MVGPHEGGWELKPPCGLGSFSQENKRSSMPHTHCPLTRIKHKNRKIGGTNQDPRFLKLNDVRGGRLDGYEQLKSDVDVDYYWNARRGQGLGEIDGISQEHLKFCYVRAVDKMRYRFLLF